jgi:hypothetical protein
MPPQSYRWIIRANGKLEEFSDPVKAAARTLYVCGYRCWSFVATDKTRRRWELRVGRVGETPRSINLRASADNSDDAKIMLSIELLNKAYDLFKIEVKREGNMLSISGYVVNDRTRYKQTREIFKQRKPKRSERKPFVVQRGEKRLFRGARRG